MIFLSATCATDVRAQPKRPAHEGKVGYVAQTQLFEQITQLKGDIIIPDYTALHLNSDTEEKVSVHAWCG
jgi:hypothetical protein